MTVQLVGTIIVSIINEGANTYLMIQEVVHHISSKCLLYSLLRKKYHFQRHQ